MNSFPSTKWMSSSRFSATANRWLRTAAALVLVLTVARPALSARADEPSLKLEAPAVAASTTVTATVASSPINKKLNVVQLAETPSAAAAVAQSPPLDKPAPVALAEMEKGILHPQLDDNVNRDAVRESYRRSDRPLTPEEAGSAFNYLRRKPSSRGLLELFDLTSPMPKSDLPAATAFENRRGLGESPRCFTDPTRRELGIRLF